MSDSIGFNPYIVMVVGKSGAGKSSCLEGLDNPERALYLNCENGRPLPFNAQFVQKTITHPDQVLSYVEKANQSDKFDTVIIDSITYLMDMYETKVVLPSDDTRSAWGTYAQYFKKLMNLVASSNKQYIFIAHAYSQYNKDDQAIETYVPIKGSLAKNGLESYFSTVISAKKLELHSLPYECDLLVITEDEEDLGYKHILQTRVTKETVSERIKSSKGLFNRNETFIDGNIQLVLNRLKDYYAQTKP